MLEILSTAAALGTFVVIAATAVAALIQLRQLRTTHQLQGLLAVLSLPYEPALSDAFMFMTHELAQKMKDPAFRRELENPAPDRAVHKELRVCDYYERLGSMIKYGLFEEELYFDNSSPERAWGVLEPVIAIMRRKRGPGVYDNFEYLVARSRDWDARHPNGAFPAGTSRLQLNDPWLASDATVDASGGSSRSQS